MSTDVHVVLVSRHEFEFFAILIITMLGAIAFALLARPDVRNTFAAKCASTLLAVVPAAVIVWEVSR